MFVQQDERKALPSEPEQGLLAEKVTHAEFKKLSLSRTRLTVRVLHESSKGSALSPGSLLLNRSIGLSPIYLKALRAIAFVWARLRSRRITVAKQLICSLFVVSTLTLNLSAYAAVGGSNPTPQVRAQAVGGSNPTPQAVGGSNPTPQVFSWWTLLLNSVGL